MDSFSVVSIIRLSKIIIVLTVGALAAAVVWGNATDYNSNFQFISHVMSMDSKPSHLGRSIEYRAITSMYVHHITYIFVIAMEAFIAICALRGAYNMWQTRKQDGHMFHESKKYAIIALTTCCVLWFFGFQVVAGEWFAMWMNVDWNGLSSAMRLVSYMFMALIYVSLKNDF